VFHRLRWFGAGAALGLGASVWLQRKAKAAAARYHPVGLAGTAVGKARSWPSHLRAAFNEGRSTMREREAELRRELDQQFEQSTARQAPTSSPPAADSPLTR
jgi:hypothetical protein